MKLKQEDFERIFKNHLKIESYSKSIESLFGTRSLNRINYKPYYQRNYVWDVKKASYFIESILLGTEVPPLIFFNNNNEIEVIDGRQRFESIIRFKNNKFALSIKGLTALKQLRKLTFDDLARKERSIIDNFLDSKMRIIEFALVNEPPLDKLLEDKVKKEIFSRYNSGITPLKKSEIDNAVYDEDPLSNLFKRNLKKNRELLTLTYETFFIVKEKFISEPPIENIMSFVRKFLVLSKFPINNFSRGSDRTEILTKLYEYTSDAIEDEELMFKDFEKKINYVSEIKKISKENHLNSNHLAFECLYWGITITEMEDIQIDYSKLELKMEIAKYVSDNIIKYNDKDYHYFKEIMERYSTTAKFFENKFNINLGIYLTGSSEKRQHILDIRKKDDTITKIGELEAMRVNKPEPVRNSIEDIIKIMNRRRFLVRPTYQRQEVINPTKKSSIIESILLGITLPPIFILKRENGVSEVIDGQQRLLTILGFIGSEYIDENENTAFSKNHKFSIRKPRILKEIEGLKYDELSEDQKNKILDFPLYVVEIEKSKNPNFDPIDLFIRLNDKPYPIRENSFEMWNSWVDFDVIEKIKDLTKRNIAWFNLKQLNKPTDRDRMQNEELITSLIFLDYFQNKREIDRKHLDIYQKRDRINARISEKGYISQLLSDISENDFEKSKFFESIKSTESLIKKIKFILLDKDIIKDELFDYLKNELDIVYKGSSEVKYYQRKMQDFYILWYLINDLNLEMVKFHRLKMKSEITEIFKFMKNIPNEYQENSIGFQKFQDQVSTFKENYIKQERKLKLTENEVSEMIKAQENKSGISGAPIFLGDDIEVDHSISIATGGTDDINNINIAHKDENRSKGSKRLN